MESSVSQQTDNLQDITEYMERHYAEKLAVGRIASHFGYSREYFSRLFKKYTGQTPGEYRENIMLNARPAAEKEAEQL